MKKPIEEVVGFTVKVPKANKSIKLRLINTTNMREVSKILCELLDLSKNGTKISYSKSHFPHPITDIHTLRQMGLRNGDVIFASLNSTLPPSRYESGVYFQDEKNANPKVIGWNHIYEDVRDAFSSSKKSQIFDEMIEGNQKEAKEKAELIRSLKVDSFKDRLGKLEIPSSKLE